MMVAVFEGDSREETRSTIKRWKDSEVRLRQLEHEVQRIEWETKKDKERYEEIIARLERERVLERELGGAEGRLKGAAALRGLNAKDKSPSVVSHFVRDILQDNANLQAGVVELRELLQTSNEEVQNLREQVLQHQPADDVDSQNPSRSVPLSDQIGWEQPSSKIQQSVHVHHHYHAKLAKRERTPTVRRSSRKRTVIGLGMLPSTPESSAPATPIVGPYRYASSPVLPTSLHHPQPTRERWSIQSAATGSSLVSSYPSSLRSYFEHSSSIFDRLEAGEESSRPTSPESTGFATSPLKFNLSSGFDERMTGPLQEEEVDEVPSETTVQLEILGLEGDANDLKRDTVQEPGSQELTPKPSQILVTGDRIAHRIQPEPPDLNATDALAGLAGTEPPDIVVQADDEPVAIADPREQKARSDMPTQLTSFDPDEVTDMDIRPGLRRTASHDSLVSISGMDIHIAKRSTATRSQSSSMIRGNKAYFALPPSAARRMPSAQPLTTVTEYTALSSMRSLSSDGSPIQSASPRMPLRSVSSSVAALSGIAASHNEEQQPSSGGLGRLVGGWVRGRWGVAPTRSTADLRSSAASVSTSSSTETQPQSEPPFSFPGGRMPGINQKGSIPGLRLPPRSTVVQVKMMNEEGLRETLAE